MEWSTGMTWGTSSDGIGRPPGLKGGWYESRVGVELVGLCPVCDGGINIEFASFRPTHVHSPRASGGLFKFKLGFVNRRAPRDLSDSTLDLVSQRLPYVRLNPLVAPSGGRGRRSTGCISLSNVWPPGGM